MAFKRLRVALNDDALALRYSADCAIAEAARHSSLNDVIVSVPRPVVQGSRTDRDLHCAGWVRAG